MKVFYLKTNVKSSASAILYPKGKIYDGLYDYAVAGKINANDLPKYLIGRSQSGISRSDLSKLDYLHAFGGVPIFSNRLLDLLGESNKDFESVKTIVISEGCEIEFNIIKIINRMELLDCEKSGVCSRNLLVGAHFKKDIGGDSMLAREVNPLSQSTFVASESFVTWARKNKLNILFKEVSYAA